MSAAIGAQAGTLDELQPSDPSHGDGFRWGIAQGAARYGLAPTPDRQVPRLILRGPARVVGDGAPEMYRRVLLRNAPMLRRCAESAFVVFHLIAPGSMVEFSAVVTLTRAGDHAATATVRMVNMPTTNTHGQSFRTCAETMLRRMVFPMPTADTTVEWRAAFEMP